MEILAFGGIRVERPRRAMKLMLLMSIRIEPRSYLFLETGSTHGQGFRKVRLRSLIIGCE